MNTPARLSLYGAGLVAIFAAAFLGARAIVPSSIVADWQSTTESSMDQHSQTAPEIRGLSSEQGGIQLGPIAAPDQIGIEEKLSFTITTLDGVAVTEFDTEHDKQLHLIVVRADGSHFRHVHPTMSSSGEWTIPWSWEAAGTYRVFADFAPSSTGTATTLTRSIDVAGAFTPAEPSAVSTSDEVDGYTVTLAGGLSSTEHSMLTATVTKDGQAVTTLQPYLAAYGHLVALREGDLAYLHVHPDGDAPLSGATSGPEVAFMTQAPTPGRYLLYLDFKVDGVVRTAHFVLDAPATATAHDEGDSDHKGH